MKIFSGENLTILWEFLEDDDTPIINLSSYELSIIVKQQFKAVITASTKLLDDCYRITDIKDNVMTFELTKQMTAQLNGECIIELKMTQNNSVLITESMPFIVNNSIIGKNIKL